MSVSENARVSWWIVTHGRLYELILLSRSSLARAGSGALTDVPLRLTLSRDRRRASTSRRDPPSTSSASVLLHCGAYAKDQCATVRDQLRLGDYIGQSFLIVGAVTASVSR
jgi:hypothetical protein